MSQMGKIAAAKQNDDLGPDLYPDLAFTFTPDFDVNEMNRETWASMTLSDYSIREMEKELQRRGYYLVHKERYTELVNGSQEACNE